jgi:hypothetical protein
MPSSSARLSGIVCGGLSRTEAQDRGKVQLRRFGPYIKIHPADVIIAVGQGVTAGQAIGRDLFAEGLQCHRLPPIGTNEAWVAGASSEMEGRR